MTGAEWPPEDMDFALSRPWQNTWQSGPGAHQQVLDEIELGRRVAIAWGSGRVACVTRLASPDLLRQLDPCPPPHYPQHTRGQLDLFALDLQEASA